MRLVWSIVEGKGPGIFEEGENVCERIMVSEQVAHGREGALVCVALGKDVRSKWRTKDPIQRRAVEPLSRHTPETLPLVHIYNRPCWHLSKKEMKVVTAFLLALQAAMMAYSIPIPNGGSFLPSSPRH